MILYFKNIYLQVKAMTVKLYDDQSHLKEFEATVIRCFEEKGAYFAELDRTAFFPEGGGQLPDTGTLGDAKVTDVQISDEIILHRIDRPLAEGQKVTGKIDWDKRFDRMQNHSGEHILSGIIHSVYGFNNVGFHMDETVTMDVDGILDMEQLAEVELKANEVVYENVPVTACYPDDEELAKMTYRSKLEGLEHTRIVTIEGYDRCACCAPHVKSTGEIGIIKILECLYIRKCTRIVIACGSRALADYRRKHSINKEIMGMLSAKPYETGDAVSHLLDSFSEAKRTIKTLSEEKAILGLGDISKTEIECSFVFTSSLDSDSIICCINHCKEKGHESIAIFSGSDEKGYLFALSSPDSALRNQIIGLIKELGGRGGGQGDFFRGQIKRLRCDIENALEALR